MAVGTTPRLHVRGVRSHGVSGTQALGGTLQFGRSRAQRGWSRRSLPHNANVKRACRLVGIACKSWENDGWSQQGFDGQRKALLDFINGINPSDGSPEVPAQSLNAMRQTVSNLLGTLPPQFFRVTISTRSDNLAQLMFSVLMTGYMFCNAWQRLELATSLGLLQGSAMVQAEQLVGSTGGSVDDAYEPPSKLAAGSQKLQVEGQVLRWHFEDGAQRFSALDYIEQLEGELEALRQQLEAQAQRSQASPAAAPPTAASGASRLGSYDLLEYLKGLTSEQVAELTDCATPGILEAMNALVERLMGDGSGGSERNGGGGAAAWGDGSSECTAAELAQLLCWLMAVGHHLRALEVRLGLRATLDSPSSSSDGGEWGFDGGSGGPASKVPRLPPPR